MTAHQHHDRQQMDRAPGADQPELVVVDPERTGGHGGHQDDPDPADGPVRQRSLGSCELDDPQPQRRHRRKGMKGYRGSGIEQRRKTHGGLLELLKGLRVRWTIEARNGLSRNS